MKKVLLAAAVLGALASSSAADRADDDLAAVKRAVGTTVEAEAKPPAAEPVPARAEKPREDERVVEKVPEEHDRVSGDRSRRRKGEPQWIRVRIAEKGEKHSRVSVNLPLDLVRALGEDMELDNCHHGHHTVGDVLRALDSGENLVDIDDEEATVRVWVE
jgi:hypothetical protein